MVLPLHEEQVITYRSLASIIRFIGLGVDSEDGDGGGDRSSSNLVGATVTDTGECSSAFIWAFGWQFKSSELMENLEIETYLQDRD